MGEPRLSFVEGARDVAVFEAVFESAAKQGEVVQVKKYWGNHGTNPFHLHSLYLLCNVMEQSTEQGVKN